MTIKDHKHDLRGGQNWVDPYLSEEGAQKLGLEGVPDGVAWQKNQVCIDPECDALQVTPDFGEVTRNWEQNAELKTTVVDWVRRR